MLGVSVVLVLVLAACQSNTGTDSAEPEGEPARPQAATAARQPVDLVPARRPWNRSRAVGRGLRRGQPRLRVHRRGPGTGDGFALFCNGETDICDASRAITEEEVARARTPASSTSS